MAKKVIQAQMQQRRDTAANWAASNPVLLDGELGIVTDDPNLYKIGDGVTPWNDLKLRGFDGTLVQTTGDSENAVMSQKAVTEKLTELESVLPTSGLMLDKIITCQDNKGFQNRLTTPIKVKAGTAYRLEYLVRGEGAIVAIYITTTEGTISLLSNQNSTKIEGVFESDTEITEYGVNSADISLPMDIQFRISIGVSVDVAKIKDAVSKLDVETSKLNAALTEQMKDIATNYFVPSQIEDGYYMDASGNEAPTTLEGSAILNDYIPVNKGEIWHYEGGWVNVEGMGFVWGYDSEANPSVKQILVPCLESVDKDFTIPEGVRFIRAWKVASATRLYKADSFSNRLNELEMSTNERLDEFERNSFEKDVVSQNLYNPKTITNGFYVEFSSGNLSKLDSYSTTDFIKIKGGESYVQNYPQQIAFYNANKKYISGKADVVSGVPFISPTDAVYVRSCFPTTFANNFIINKGLTLANDAYAEGYAGLYIQESHIISSSPIEVIVERNSADYNSIRETIAALDVSNGQQYNVIVPKGRWHECDLQGKKGVTIIGEDMYETIIYNGPSDKITPSDYSFAAYSNMPLSDVPRIYKHIVFNNSSAIHIRSLTIEAEDCKYCVHLDNNVPNGKFVFENVRLHSKANVNYPVGIGVWSGQEIYFHSCVFDSEGYGIFAHNWNNQSKRTIIDVRDSDFNTSGYMVVDELGSEQNDEWNIINCRCPNPIVNWMVDHNGEGNPYYQVDGVNVTNPQDVPYCIKLNTLGSNVKAVYSMIFGGNMEISSRPNCERYTISENIDVLNTAFPIGNVVKGIWQGQSFNQNEAFPINVGVVQNVIDDKSYIFKKGCYVHVPQSILLSPAVGTKIYMTSEGELTREVTEHHVGYMVRTTGDKDVIYLVA